MLRRAKKAREIKHYHPANKRHWHQRRRADNLYLMPFKIPFYSASQSKLEAGDDPHNNCINILAVKIRII